MMPQRTRTNLGTVMSVRGSVVDARFEAHLPAIFSVLRCGDQGQVAVKVLAQTDQTVGKVKQVAEKAFGKVEQAAKNRRK